MRSDLVGARRCFLAVGNGLIYVDDVGLDTQAPLERFIDVGARHELAYRWQFV